MNREATDCEKILAKHMSNEGSQPEYRDSYNSVIKEDNSRFRTHKLLEQTLHRRRYTNGHLSHGKMLNIISHQQCKSIP